MNENTEEDKEGHFTFIGRQGASVIDYAITNERARREIEQFSVITYNNIKSDHEPITVKITWEQMKSTKPKVKTSRKKIIWSPATIIRYQEELSKKTMENWSEMKQAIKEAMTIKEININEDNARQAEWWDEECTISRKELRKTKALWRQNKASSEEVQIKKDNYKETCSRKQRETIELEREEIKSLRHEMDIWSYIEKDRKTKRKIKNNIKLEEWRQHFMDLLDGTMLEPDEQTEIVATSEDGVKIADIEKQISKLKNGKATGSDEIPNEAWKLLKEEGIEKLALIMNKCWREGGIEEEWREGIIYPIYKAGNKEEAKSYRGITLLNTVYKLWAMILAEKLEEEVERKHIIPEGQAGFRKGRSTTDNIYVLNYAIEKEIRQKAGKAYIFFADLKAAFDNVNRSKLFEMMKQYNLNEILIARIEEIYKKTTNIIKSEEGESKFWTMKGLRQGCPLSPILFAIYTADLEQELQKEQTGGIVLYGEKIKMLAFADDIALIANRPQELEQIMERFREYLDKKELQLNTGKSKIMIARKGGGKRPKYVWKWNNIEIEIVKNYKYLGYYFNERNTSTTHIRYITKKAKAAMSQIWGIGKRKFRNDWKMRIMLFDAICTPMMLYGAEVWGFKTREEIERIQRQYIKWTLQLNKTTPSYIVLAETNRDCIDIKAGKRAMKYEENIRNHEDNRYTKKSG